MLGGQEVEHVKGALPAGGREERREVHNQSFEMLPTDFRLGFLLAEQEEYHCY